MSKSIDTFDGTPPPYEDRLAAVEAEIRDQFKAYCVLEGRFAAVEANNVSLNAQMRRGDDIVQRVAALEEQRIAKLEAKVDIEAIVKQFAEISSIEARCARQDTARITALETEIMDQFKAYCVLEGRFAAVEANNVSLNAQMRRSDDIVQRLAELEAKLIKQDEFRISALEDRTSDLEA